MEKVFLKKYLDVKDIHGYKKAEDFISKYSKYVYFYSKDIGYLEEIENQLSKTGLYSTDFVYLKLNDTYFIIWDTLGIHFEPVSINNNYKYNKHKYLLWD